MTYAEVELYTDFANRSSFAFKLLGSGRPKALLQGPKGPGLAQLR
jgi:hypothetical protein